MSRLALSALLLLAAVVTGKANDRNPDRWPTSDLQLGGNSTVKGDQVTTKDTYAFDQLVRTRAVSITELGILPVADAWTILISAGSSWTDFSTVGDPTNTPTTVSTDNSLVNYSLGARHYFLDHHIGKADPADNPDRWPSLSLTLGGATAVNYSASTSNFNFDRSQATQNLNATIETRLPVSDAWTLTAAAGATRNYSKIDPSYDPINLRTIGSKTLEEDLTISAGFRYFLVGQNLMLKDGKMNPDRWTMLGLTLSGTGSLYDRQLIDDIPPGAEHRRPSSPGTRVYAATAESRLPITDHLSLRFDLNGSYSRTWTPFTSDSTPKSNGFLNRNYIVGFAGAVRYFFF